MSVNIAELGRFQRFAERTLNSGRPCGSLEDLVDLWRIEEPSAAELQDSVEALQRGIADAEAGRLRPAAEVFADLRSRLASGAGT